MIEAVAFMPNTPTLIGDLGADHKETVRALRSFGEEIAGKIDAVVVMTPHFQTSGSFGVVGAERLRQIFDFHGFPPEFYEVRYEPPGDPQLAEQIIKLGKDTGIRIVQAGNWGLDHGAWSPLFHIFKDADIPTVPLSICPDLGYQAHMALGRIMRSRSITGNLCVLSTGSLIHRLDLFQAGNDRTPPKALEYLDICISSFMEGRWDGIWNAPPDLVNAASPEGYNLQLRFIQGVVGDRFRTRILANEVEFNAASLTTAVFEEA
ncbi:MAG: dioxygenase [Thermoplasmata archaeon]